MITKRERTKVLLEMLFENMLNSPDEDLRNIVWALSDMVRQREKANHE